MQINCSSDVSFLLNNVLPLRILYIIYLTMKSFFLPPNLLHITRGCKLLPNTNFTSAFNSRVDVFTLSYRTNFELISYDFFFFFYSIF